MSNGQYRYFCVDKYSIDSSYFERDTYPRELPHNALYYGKHFGDDFFFEDTKLIHQIRTPY